MFNFFFVHGMKRNVSSNLREKDLILPANGESLPQETLEKIFTYLCDIPIDVPLVQEPAQTSFFYSFKERCCQYLSWSSDFFILPERELIERNASNEYQLKIAPNGIVACLAKMRSVCTHWRDNLLSPIEIKRRLSIDTDDIVKDLAKIKVFNNQKNYFHVHFLAEMIRGGSYICNHLVPSNICSSDDVNKLKIFLENDVINPRYERDIHDALAECRRNKIFTLALRIGWVIGCVICYFICFELYKISCMSGWNSEDHFLKKMFSPESLCNFCNKILKENDPKYIFYRYHSGTFCNVCNGTSFESSQTLYSKCIEEFFEYCKNQC